MNQFTLTGYKAIITGAGSGIGAGIAHAFAEAGAAELYLLGRTISKLKAIEAELKDRFPTLKVETYSVDLTNTTTISKFCKDFKNEHSELDILVNNAGYFFGEDPFLTSEEQWQAQISTNLSAPFFLVKGLGSLLGASKNSSILNISSTLAKKAIQGAAAYNSSKAGVLHLTRSLALDLAPKIRVNCILPAVVDTPMYTGRFSTAEEANKSLEAIAKWHPLKRVGKPEDVANAAVFLCSPAASWITGAELAVDGGMLCT